MNTVLLIGFRINRPLLETQNASECNGAVSHDSHFQPSMEQRSDDFQSKIKATYHAVSYSLSVSND